MYELYEDCLRITDPAGCGFIGSGFSTNFTDMITTSYNIDSSNMYKLTNGKLCFKAPST